MLLKVTDNISMIQSELGFTYCNCVLIDDDVRAVIDTGADAKSLTAVSPENIDMVLYTHHHYDHTRGNPLFEKSKTFIHEADCEALTTVEAFTYYNSLDQWEDLMPGYDFLDAAAQIGILENAPYWSIDGTFKDGQLFDFGKTKVEVLHTPGHSAGHCSFWFPDQELLFTGDICLTKVGPWYGEICANPNEMLQSIQRLIDLKPRFVTSCHINDISENGVEMLHEFKNRIYKRDERILNYLKTNPTTVEDIANHHLIYRIHPTPFVLFWEKLMVIKHLQRLENMGLIISGDNGIYIAE